MTMQQRRPAKALADPAQWRSRVRAECLQRVKDQRAGLLWRLRQVRTHLVFNKGSCASTTPDASLCCSRRGSRAWEP